MSEPAAVHPIVGLAAQVATQRALGRRWQDDRRQGRKLREGKKGKREQRVTERNRDDRG